MKNIKNLMFLSLALLLILPMAFAQETLPVYIDEAKIDGTTIYPNAWNTLSIERGSEFELKLYLASYEDVDDVEVDAFISGYEYNNKDKIAGHVGPFDLDEDITYTKKINLKLPEDLDLDEYSLRVFITDRYNGERIYTYNINVDAPRHELKLKDVMLNPNYEVQAGAGFVTKVRLENIGQKDEDSVKIVVGIPELNIKASEYIDEIESDEEEESEEIFIRLPKCAQSGEHVVSIEVFYNNGNNKITAFTKLNVGENPRCAKEEDKAQQIQVIVPQEQAGEGVAVVTEETTEQAPVTSKKSFKTVLEIALIILVALLIIVGFAIGFSRWRQEE